MPDNSVITMRLILRFQSLQVFLKLLKAFQEVQVFGGVQQTHYGVRKL
jgi:hypothetical protein